MRVELSETQLSNLRRGRRLHVAWPEPVLSTEIPNLPDFVNAAFGDALQPLIRSCWLEELRVSWPDGRPSAPSCVTEVLGALIKDGKQPRGASYWISAIVVDLARDPSAPAPAAVQWVARFAPDGETWFPPPSAPVLGIAQSVASGSAS